MAPAPCGLAGGRFLTGTSVRTTFSPSVAFVPGATALYQNTSLMLGPPRMSEFAENDPKQGAQELDFPHQRIWSRNEGYRAQGDQDRRESARQRALPYIADNVRYDKTRKEGAPMWPRESSWPASPAGTAAHTTNPTAAALRSWRAATSVGVRPAALACWSHPQLVKVGADPQARSAW